MYTKIGKMVQLCYITYGCGNQKKDDPPVVSILTFNIDDIPEGDFLSRVCATVGVEQAKAKLGWKTCDDKKKAAYRRLKTHDDVKHAFEVHRKMLDSKRREKAERPKDAEKPAPKASESATEPNVLRKVKNAALQCAMHPGPNRWCYVRHDMVTGLYTAGH
ncbi:hypothetical protein V8E53_012035 [Lactarius tabidus]